MQYQAPANDLRFLLFDVLGADKLHELEKYADATPDLISAVIDEAGKLAAEVIQPTNQVGDRQSCSYDPETKLVKTPDGFKAAYDKFVEGGWIALDAPIEFGGQGLIRTRATPNDDGSYAIEGLEQATLWLAQNAPKDPEQAGAAATPYLRLMALTVIGYLWSRMAGVAGQQLEAGEGNKPLLESKQASARFYFEKLMPETDWLLKDIQSERTA